MFSVSLCHLVRQSTKTGSKYAAAKVFNIAPTGFDKWYKGKGTMSNEYGLQAAKYLDIDPAPVLMGLVLERAARASDTHEIRRALYDNINPAKLDALPIQLQRAINSLIYPPPRTFDEIMTDSEREFVLSGTL